MAERVHACAENQSNGLEAEAIGERIDAWEVGSTGDPRARHPGLRRVARCDGHDGAHLRGKRGRGPARALAARPRPGGSVPALDRGGSPWRSPPAPARLRLGGGEPRPGGPDPVRPPDLTARHAHERRPARGARRRGRSARRRPAGDRSRPAALRPRARPLALAPDRVRALRAALGRDGRTSRPRSQDRLLRREPLPRRRRRRADQPCGPVRRELREGPARPAARDRGPEPGLADDYKPKLEGQFLDVSSVPAGRYLLVHRTNVDGRLRESRRGNDAASVLLSLRRPRGAPPDVRVLRTCPDTPTCP